MVRIPATQLERLKAEVAVERLAAARGIALARTGADPVGLCPFHDDPEPSLVITPATIAKLLSFAGRGMYRAARRRCGEGQEPPTSSEIVTATMRGIRRELGAAPDRKAPATSEVVLDWKGGSPGDSKDLHQAMHAAASRVWSVTGSEAEISQRIHSTPLLWKAGKKPTRADRGPDRRQ